jgi:predicted TIM-barrel fold metal-dependent hydrolase
MENTSVVDGNVNIGPALYDTFEFEPTLEELAARLTAAGIGHGVVAPLAPPSLDYDAANARLAAQIGNDERFTGIGRIDPRRDAAVENAERALTEYDLQGLKLHPWEDSFSVTSAVVPPVLSVAARHDVPVWIHAGYPHVSHSLALRDLASEHPEVQLVLTHGAQLDISGLSLSDALLLANDTDNTWFELSGVYRRDFIEDLVSDIGSERVLFGSNAPYFHPQVEKTRVVSADITEAQREQILGDTVASLLG